MSQEDWNCVYDTLFDLADEDGDGMLTLREFDRFNLLLGAAVGIGILEANPEIDEETSNDMKCQLSADVSKLLLNYSTEQNYFKSDFDSIDEQSSGKITKEVVLSKFSTSQFLYK